MPFVTEVLKFNDDTIDKLNETVSFLAEFAQIEFNAVIQRELEPVDTGAYSISLFPSKTDNVEETPPKKPGTKGRHLNYMRREPKAFTAKIGEPLILGTSLPYAIKLETRAHRIEQTVGFLKDEIKRIDESGGKI